MIAAKIIIAEDKDLYVYGLQQGMLIAMNTLTVLAIGFYLNMAWQSMVFYLAFVPLRSYSGGYHAKTPLSCYIFSVVMIVAALLGIKLIPWNSFICYIVTICAGGVILLLSPVEDSNKPLDQVEIAVYRKRTHIILSILTVAALIFWFVDNQQLSISIITALIMLSLMLILGKYKHIIGGKHKNSFF